MDRVPCHRLVPIGRNEAVDLITVAFGEKLPKSAGVYVVLTAPQNIEELKRGFGSIIFVSSCENLDAAIGSEHGGHPRFWSLIAKRAAEVGYILTDSAAERSRISGELTRIYLQ